MTDNLATMLDAVDADMDLLASAKHNTMPMGDDLLLAWLRIANGEEPTNRDLVALLARTPAPMLIGLALGLQMARAAHPAMNGTPEAIATHAMAAPIA